MTALVFFVVVTALLVLYAARSRKEGAEPVTGSSASSRPQSRADDVAASDAAQPGASPHDDSRRDDAVISALTPPLDGWGAVSEATSRVLHPGRENLESYVRWSRYPPWSRPASEARDAFGQHPGVPTTRPLDPDAPAGVLIRQEQDRLFLAAGQTAVLRFGAVRDGAAVVSRIRSAELLRVNTRTRAQVAVSAIRFRDDGEPPDGTASDLVWSAMMAPSDDDLVGDLQVVVEAEAEDATGRLTFPLVYTGQPTAAFTGVVREAVEDGSLALYVGVNFITDGHYVIVGKLYGAQDGRAIALLRFNDVVTAGGPDEVRLVAFGKILRDERAVSPFELRDLEGWRMTGGVPDRRLMAPWRGPYRTKAYDPNAFSPQEWMAPERLRRIAGLRRAAEVGGASPRDRPH